jgi:hypothetical protein
MHSHPTTIRTIDEMESIDWKRNADAAFEEARRTGRMVLLDFSAAPM